MNESPHEQVAAEVRAALARHRWTGKGMAAELGWNHMYMSRRLRGRVAFDVNDLAAIAAALKVPVFCGEYECDGSGYNCPDDYYGTYNEGEILEWSG